MKKRNAGGGGDDSGGWLNTYADMVTLLLTFFAVLLSMSTTDTQKFNAFIEAFSSLPPEEVQEIIAAGATGESEEPMSDLSELYDSLTEYVEENALQDDVKIQMRGDIISVTFDGAAFFFPDSFAILPESVSTVHAIGEALVEFESQIRMINVLGFTATVENGTYWVLSAERAAVVVEYFEFENGFPKEKMVPQGYGNQYPVASNDTEEGMRQNRRVELVIMGTNTDSAVDIPEILEDFQSGGDEGSSSTNATEDDTADSTSDETQGSEDADVDVVDDTTQSTDTAQDSENDTQQNTEDTASGSVEDNSETDDTQVSIGALE